MAIETSNLITIPIVVDAADILLVPSASRWCTLQREPLQQPRDEQIHRSIVATTLHIITTHVLADVRWYGAVVGVVAGRPPGRRPHPPFERRP